MAYKTIAPNVEIDNDALFLFLMDVSQPFCSSSVMTSFLPRRAAL